jgi:UDP:flavonoid glycosyltransferase YjiC (YdhE family)
MVLVCGPRFSPGALKVPEGVEVRGYVPDLYEHFAACDLAVVMGTGTSTIELTALRRPFLYFPIEKHFEQCIHVAGRIARHKAGTRMRYYKTTPETLADEILKRLGKEATYAPIPTDGAERAAQIIGGLLSKV